MISDEINLAQQFTAVLREGTKYRALANRDIIRKTVKELVDSPYILRFHLNNGGLIYFVGNDENYFHFKGKGKNVHWLHDLFENLRQTLIEKKTPNATNLYNLPLIEIAGYFSESFVTKVAVDPHAWNEAYKPYLDKNGDLVIPTEAPARYLYWQGGQSILETLKELEVSEEVIEKYCSKMPDGRQKSTENEENNK